MNGLDNQETFIGKYIPSSDVRRLITESHHIFSDWDKAAIIWNSMFPLQNKWESLQAIAEETTDDKLKEQILQRLTYDMDAYLTFKENAEGFVYTLSSYWMELNQVESPFFGNSGIARKEGCRIGGGSDFSVEKHQVISEVTQIIKNRTIYSPYFEAKESLQLEQFDTGGVNIATCFYNGNGELMSIWTCELPKDQDLLVNSMNNERFENKYVVFPNPFEKFEKMRFIGDVRKDKRAMWIGESNETWAARVKEACGNRIYADYSDANIFVEYWDENRSEWGHDHITPIYLERDTEVLCNSYKPGKSIVAGHDTGASVWIQPVQIDCGEKILQENIHETGIEISLEQNFFCRLLRPLFIDAFDPELSQNKNRFTYAFSDEGRYLKGFAEECLEHNFFTYQQMEDILKKIGEIDQKKIELQEFDPAELINFETHIRHIMESCSETGFISVMS